MKKKAFALILSLCMVLSLIPLAAMPANAEGEIPLDTGVLPASGATYTISNAEQLKRLSDLVSSGNECSGATFVLTADIVLNDGVFAADASGEPLYGGKAVSAANQPGQWVPIGNSSAQFAGVFDGNGHTVSGLFFDNSSQDCVGLFGRINSGAQIKNVGVINSYIRGNNYVGGVCGNNNGAITCSYNTGGVSGSGNVGGVCGENYYGKITSCYNTGSVSGEDRYVGGVCGNNNSAITSCYNTGIVRGDLCVGGVCGGNYYGKITSCCNTGSVSGEGDYVGGVCGWNDGTITNCYNKGGVNSTDGYVGGVCGESSGAITNCYSTGSVSGDEYAGGVCGESSTGTITNCYYLGDTASGGIDGEDTAGQAEKRTEAEMKDAAFLTAINNGGSAFISSFNGLNGGYPMLKALCEFTGEGTAESPYLIYNANQLNYMSYLVNFDNDNYGDKEYKLMADITLNGKKLSADSSGDPLYGGEAVSAENQPEKWFPIGITGFINGGANQINVYFQGVFDGNSHTVSGLFFDNAKQNCAGLFGQISTGAQIKNVSVINSYIRGNNSVGGVCGYNDEGAMENCSNTGSVRGISGVGGVCGYNSGTITSCYNTGIVRGSSSVGGVCGNSKDTISNCYNTGSVSGDESVGGVCGSNNTLSSITNCYNTGSVSGEGNYVGGVCGFIGAAIVNCYYLSACGAAGEGTSKTEADMKDAAFVKELNGEGIAFIPSFDGLNNGYPLLKEFHKSIYIEFSSPTEQRTIALAAKLTDSIEQIKALAGEALGVPASEQVLTFNGQYLTEGSALADFGIDYEDTIGLCTGTAIIIGGRVYRPDGALPEGMAYENGTLTLTDYRSGSTHIFAFCDFYISLVGDSVIDTASDTPVITVGNSPSYIGEGGLLAVSTPPESSKSYLRTSSVAEGNTVHLSSLNNPTLIIDDSLLVSGKLIISSGCTLILSGTIHNTGEIYNYNLLEGTGTITYSGNGRIYNGEIMHGQRAVVGESIVLDRTCITEIISDHPYGAWESNGDGTHTRACTVCDETVAGHFDTADCTEAVDAAVAATCYSAGLTEGSHCSVCGGVLVKQEETQKLAHTYGEWESNSNGTHTRACTVCGETADGHFDTADCALTATVTPPACAARGYTTHTCADCGYSYTDAETAATGHHFGSWHFEGGSIVRTCESCGKNESLFTAAWLSLVRIFSSAWMPMAAAFNAIWIKIIGSIK